MREKESKIRFSKEDLKKEAAQAEGTHSRPKPRPPSGDKLRLTGQEAKEAVEAPDSIDTNLRKGRLPEPRVRRQPQPVKQQKKKHRKPLVPSSVQKTARQRRRPVSSALKVRTSIR